MTEPETTPNSIIFTVPSNATIHIRRWQQEVNRELIAAQLARNGETFVTRLGRRHTLTTITELPELGEAEPYAGDFGGMYTFAFVPQSDSFELQVMAAAALFKRVGVDTVPPLVLQLPRASVIFMVRTPLYNRDWSDPQLNREEDEAFVHEVTLAELEFPIDGTMYERLCAWGWDRLQIEAYRYVFVPLSVGCELAVEHLPSGQKVHLTEDVGW